MKFLIKICVLIHFAFLTSSPTQAETWDEPWQKEVIKNADYFVLATVLSNIDSVGTEIEISKSFGNQKLEGKIFIDRFSLLRLMSASGHGVHFKFKEGDKLYFFLSKTEDNHFAIATPTTGFAYLDDENQVYATYRHSYHQCLIPKEIYERTYTQIWMYYKTGSFEKNNIMNFINTQIDNEVAGFEKEEIDLFFLQHAALETAYLLDLSIDLNRITKFISSDNYHSRISALRLLGNSPKEDVKQFLFDYITQKTTSQEENNNFEKVIAIWALYQINDKKYNRKLFKVRKKMSDEPSGFGGNIMDPRVGTYFPSPRGAIKK